MRYLLSMAACVATALAAAAQPPTPRTSAVPRPVPPPAVPPAKEEPKKEEPKTDTPKGGVREIDLKDVKLPAKEGAEATEPTIIKTEEELKKAVGEGAAKGMTVDFKADYLILFQWDGSGGDVLTHATATKDEKTVVTSVLTPGLTRDLRQHAKLIVLPAGAEWKMAK